jgi:phosphatidylinositol alpha-mannosyltransferase
VATFHTSQERPRALAASANLLRPWLDRIDAHIAVSTEAARTLGRYLPLDPQVIPNGLSVAEYAGPGSRNGDTLLFLGRIDERRKGLHVLLDAWPEIRTRRPDVRLLVAGPGRRLSLPDGVQLLGELSEPDKVAALKRSDVLVAPNTHGESFGMVLAEAMAAGTPVVAHALPAFRDVLGGGRYGVLFTDDLVAQVLALLEDPERRAGLAAAAEREVRRYDWAAVAPQVEEVYADLLEAPEATAV